MASRRVDFSSLAISSSGIPSSQLVLCIRLIYVFIFICTVSYNKSAMPIDAEIFCPVWYRQYVVELSISNLV